MDLAPPVDSCPSDTVAERAGPGAITVEVPAVTAYDPRDLSPGVSRLEEPSNVPAGWDKVFRGRTTVTCIVSASSGGDAIITFTADLLDSTPPRIAVAAELVTNDMIGPTDQPAISVSRDGAGSTPR